LFARLCSCSSCSGNDAIPMYSLSGSGATKRRIYAALNSVIYTMFGSILMLVAILWLYHAAAVAGYPTFDVSQIQTLLSNGTITLPLRTEFLLFGAFFPGICHQGALFPLHTWLPDAHTEAPTAGSVMLAGRASENGDVRHVAFLPPFFPEASRRFSHLLSPCLPSSGLCMEGAGCHCAGGPETAGGLLVGQSTSGLWSSEFSRFIPSRFRAPCFRCSATESPHGMLFSASGMLYDRRQHAPDQGIRRLATPMPVLARCTCLRASRRRACRCLTEFVGEFLISRGTFQKHAAWASWAALGVIFSSVYLLWSYQRSFLRRCTAGQK